MKSLWSKQVDQNNTLMLKIFPSIEVQTKLKVRINPPHLQQTLQDFTNGLSNEFVQTSFYIFSQKSWNWMCHTTRKIIQVHSFLHYRDVSFFARMWNMDTFINKNSVLNQTITKISNIHQQKQTWTSTVNVSRSQIWEYATCNWIKIV